MNFEKTYHIPAELFREGYRAYQKKYVYPKNYIFMAIFLVLAANFVYGAVLAPGNYLAYLLIFICLALAFREWYNPRKIRDAVMETVHQMGDPLYKLTVTDEYLEISTEDIANDEPQEDDTDEDDVAEEELPKPTKLPLDGDLKVLEYEKFFLAVYGKEMFYIIPKDGFTDEELETLRSVNAEKTK